MSLTETPRANRIHIGIFGKRNSGKSSLINALTGQNIALVSEIPGTTTDPVYKAMELFPIGPVVFIDTAGFDDIGELGMLRIEKTEEALLKTDIGIVIFSEMTDLSYERKWIGKLRDKNTPIICIVNKSDLIQGQEETVKQIIRDEFSMTPIFVNNKNRQGISEIKEELAKINLTGNEEDLLRGLVHAGELVLLVMPQDIQAPKGRLILPQVQMTRALLDRGCTIISTTLSNLDHALSVLKLPPKLIITDSQCFNAVYSKKPPESLLTSFSVLYAANKGDIDAFIEGANAIDHLDKNSRVLIAEACTHAPLEEDIGRIKIPNILKARYGDEMVIHVVTGIDFPENLSSYDLIIHCGACMFNKKYMDARINSARQKGVSITNYGIALAKFSGILDKIVY